MWLPPGGHCEANEDPATAAVREAQEETGLSVEVVPTSEAYAFPGPAVLPPPVAVLVEDIVRPDQPFHQHIDFVYFTRPPESADLSGPMPAGPHQWIDGRALAGALALANPDGTLVTVAEDVRVLGIRAIEAVARRS